MRACAPADLEVSALPVGPTCSEMRASSEMQSEIRSGTWGESRQGSVGGAYGGNASLQRTQQASPYVHPTSIVTSCRSNHSQSSRTSLYLTLYLTAPHHTSPYLTIPYPTLHPSTSLSLTTPNIRRQLSRDDARQSESSFLTRLSVMVVGDAACGHMRWRRWPHAIEAVICDGGGGQGTQASTSPCGRPPLRKPAGWPGATPHGPSVWASEARLGPVGAFALAMPWVPRSGGGSTRLGRHPSAVGPWIVQVTWRRSIGCRRPQ